MKKSIYVLTMVLVVLCLLSSCGEKSDFIYEKVEGGISITGYTGENMKVVIPEEINGKAVVSIGEAAFDKQLIESVEIPDSVKMIEQYAFRRCGKLTSIKLPEGLKEISAGMFTFCSSLHEIDIPDSVEFIGNNAFGGTSLTNVVLPDSVNKLDDYVFYNCTHLVSFTSGKGLTEIGNFVFSNCISLKDITFNEGVKTAGDNCFEYCSSLSKIDLPSTLEKLSIGFFSHSAIENITVPSGVKVIESYAFEGCKSLQNIYIPDTVEEMKVDIFNESRGFTIHGVRDSEAEIYADTYGYKFEEYNFE